MGPTDDARRGATIYSVADQAGVSIATVSRVLQGSPVVSERTRRKVLDAVEDLDYLPSGAARSLAVRHHDTYGLVLPELSGPYYAELLVGFETRAAELEQSVMLVLAGTKEDRDRAAAHARHPGRRHRRARLGRRERRHAAASRSSSSPATPARGIEAIAAENVEGARLLTEHLLEHGRTDLRLRRRHRRRPRPPRALRGLRRRPPRARPDAGRPGARRVPRARRHRRRRAAARRRLHRRRPRLRQRRARPGRHGPAHRRRRRRARRHRRRRLGRRHDRPLRATRPDHRAPAGAASSAPSPPTASTTSSPAPTPSAERRVLATEVVIRSSCGCPPGTRPASEPAAPRAGSPRHPWIHLLTPPITAPHPRK